MYLLVGLHTKSISIYSVDIMNVIIIITRLAQVLQRSR
jgi:hypothetical protein